jgi:hypothetical protein
MSETDQVDHIAFLDRAAGSGLCFTCQQTLRRLAIRAARFAHFSRTPGVDNLDEFPTLREFTRPTRNKGTSGNISHSSAWFMLPLYAPLVARKCLKSHLGLHSTSTHLRQALVSGLKTCPIFPFFGNEVCRRSSLSRPASLLLGSSTRTKPFSRIRSRTSNCSISGATQRRSVLSRSGRRRHLLVLCFIAVVGTKLGTIKTAETRGQSRLSLAESVGS